MTWCLVLLLPWMPAAYADGNESALKAAFLYNFALYTEWPQLPGSFEYCIAGADDLGSALDALARREIAGRAIRLRRILGGEVPATCNILFVATAEKARGSRWMELVRNRPVLTVADVGLDGGFPTMLQLQVDQGRVVFTANLTRAKSSGLGFSSKMLRLARSVE